MNARAALLLAVALLLVAPSFAAAPTSSLYDYDALKLQLHIGNSLNIVPQGGSPAVDRVTADLSWYPRDSYREGVRSVATSPQAYFEEGVYRYEWEKPQLGTLALSLDAVVETTNEQLPVRNKVAFPIATLPSELAQYTEPSALIDVNDDIAQQALRLSEGKDDLFEVVYTVADWVTTNIEYNLSSVSADATEPSSWVMEHRKGVCKEMTALFISMLRSLGIPARFVSGVSYTNLPEFANPWGGHAWAEVWFPGTGWVPFDPTYGTYGYVDATHLKLQDSLDAQSGSIDFTMFARDASIVTRDLDLGVQVLDKRRSGTQLFSVELQPFDDVALDSYDLLTATVTNDAGQYVSTRLTLGRTEGLELIGQAERTILLKPHETKRLTYLVRTEGLRNGFSYTFPVTLYAGLREVASTSFEARRGNPAYDREFFSQYLEATDGTRKGEANLTCAPDKRNAYLNSTVTIACSLDAVARGATGCIGERCIRLDSPSFSATRRCDTPGMKAVLATAESYLFSSSAVVRYSCLDQARVAITNLSAPASLGFGERGSIDLLLERRSETLPENVTISITHSNFNESWEVARLAGPQRFSLGLTGASLDLSGNDVLVLVTYTDALGTAYREERTLAIEPRDFSFLEKVRVVLSDIERWLERKLGR